MLKVTQLKVMVRIQKQAVKALTAPEQCSAHFFFPAYGCAGDPKEGTGAPRGAGEMQEAWSLTSHVKKAPGRERKGEQGPHHPLPPHPSRQHKVASGP